MLCKSRKDLKLNKNNRFLPTSVQGTVSPYILSAQGLIRPIQWVLLNRFQSEPPVSILLCETGSRSAYSWLELLSSDHVVRPVRNVRRLKGCQQSQWLRLSISSECHLHKPSKWLCSVWRK